MVDACTRNRSDPTQPKRGAFRTGRPGAAPAALPLSPARAAGGDPQNPRPSGAPAGSLGRDPARPVSSPCTPLKMER